MAFTFEPATKEEAKLRMAIGGPSGSGKTYSALAIASAIVAREGGKIAVIDTERGSASLYSDEFKFDRLNLTKHSPADFREAIAAADEAQYSVLIIDSLSHAWIGRGGALEMVDKAQGRAEGSGNKNSFFAWRNVTPEHNKLVDAILSSRCHVIVTMRSKQHYEIENQNGKLTPVKMGMELVQRDGIEYEFQITGDMDYQHSMRITKTRCRALDKDDPIPFPGTEFANVIMDWLGQGIGQTQEEENERHAIREEMINILTQMGKKNPVDLYRKEFHGMILPELREKLAAARAHIASGKNA